jgi:hypothetical protein
MKPPLKSARSYLFSAPVILLAFFIVSGAGFLSKGKMLLFPGPISATAPKGEPLNGYPNHAAFEQNCQHCHSPVHCITDSRCESCHLEIARQRTSADEGLHSRLPDAGRCQACHLEHQGREVVITEFAFLNVDHRQLSGFSLEKHQKDYAGEQLNCRSCHGQDRYISQTLDCLTCHVEEDHDFMAEHLETYGSTCVPCHDGSGRFSGWEHDQVYPLDGAHQDLECQECHLEGNFLETPRECSGCHEDPEVHLGSFGLDCQRCHTSQAWTPAYLTDHTFDLDHGSQQPLECSTCHTDHYSANTCYGCHDHQPAEMMIVHFRESIYVYDHCADCHPTGETQADRLLRIPVQAADPLTSQSSGGDQK